MAIDTGPGRSAEQTQRRSVTGDPGTTGPTAPPPTTSRPAWLGQHLGTALIGAVGGYALGHFIGNVIASGYTNIQGSGQNDVAIVLGLSFGVLGWLLGSGTLNYPLAKMVGKEPLIEVPEQSWVRYFKFTTDHKVVGIQYLFGVLTFLFTGGLLAMAIRTELLNPTNHVFGPGTYIALVGEHGTIMMMMASSVVIGPLGNYLVPLMIGSRRAACPRVEAASFWIFAAGYFVILAALPLGGFPTGWTGYAPLQTQASGGMDAYLVGFAVIGLGMILAGFNLAVTIIHYRAPGMTWSRIPIFVWSILATAALLTLATPTLVAAGLFGILDRTAQTAFFVNEHGGSSFLWQNLFWFFGHPEVYIMALPGFGIVGEILPVFCRKPLFGYRVAAAGMMGVALLSFFVWQHHLFQSGINPDMRPLFMLTTELISIPTGFIFLVGLGTLWKAKIRLDVPMLFALGMFFNFLIGGITGVFLSDTPVDVTVHGSFFVLAHFHYTIMGGLIFAFFGGVYYWTPKLTGRMMDKRLGKIHFWTMFLFFNMTFFPLFIVGLLGQPRRVFEYASNLQTWNDFSSVSAFFLGASFLIFVGNFVWTIIINPRPAPANPWDSNGLEWQTANPVPYYNFERIPVVLADPYHYGEPVPVPVADLGAGVRAAGVTVGAQIPSGELDPEASAVTGSAVVPPPGFNETPEEVAYELRAAEGAIWTGSRLLMGVAGFAFASLAFAYFYLRSANNDELWRPHGVSAPTSIGAAIFAFTVAAGALSAFGSRRLRQDSRIDWLVAGWTVVTAGLIVIGLQVWELTRLSFYPGSSGYASCFIAWSVMNVTLVLGATYWTETLLARSIRLHKALVEEGAVASALPAQRLFRANAEGSTAFWEFVAVVGAFFWLLFYVI